MLLSAFAWSSVLEKSGFCRHENIIASRSSEGLVATVMRNACSERFVLKYECSGNFDNRAVDARLLYTYEQLPEQPSLTLFCFYFKRSQ